VQSSSWLLIFIARINHASKRKIPQLSPGDFICQVERSLSVLLPLLAAMLTALLTTLLAAMLTTLLAAAALLATLTSRRLILLTGFLLTALLLAALLFATHHASPSRNNFRLETMFSYDVCSWSRFFTRKNKLAAWNNVPRIFPWLQKRNS
jgi:dolichyl-phosphate-mannose--protein O-mannosyl transferase